VLLDNATQEMSEIQENPKSDILDNLACSLISAKPHAVRESSSQYSSLAQKAALDLMLGVGAEDSNQSCPIICPLDSASQGCTHYGCHLEVSIGLP